MAGNNGLNDTFVKNLKSSDQKKHFDGGGLYIFLTKAGSKLWRMVYRFGGKEKTLSFGSYLVVSLKRARQLRDEAKEQLAAGIATPAKSCEWRYTTSKTNTPHIVPLAPQVMAILKELHPMTGHGEWLFPHQWQKNQPIGKTTLLAALSGMGISGEEMTPHGFRAMARTLLDEVLGERYDLIEQQLAHMVRDPNGRAYSDLETVTGLFMGRIGNGDSILLESAEVDGR